ncbi:hypothetical protein [Vibrio vulnificus]|uniref:hypothetical protein n=1 Tax=Vibrio vulnificus TaxID=672 RepID=UPI0040591E59
MERQNTDISLSKLVIRNIERYLEETNTKRESFVKERLLPRLVELGYESEPTEAGDYARWVNSTSKRLSRYLSGENDMKADAILAFVSSLPKEHLTRTMNELCGIFGTYYMPMTLLDTAVNRRAIKSQLSEISEEFGNVLKNCRPVLDGEIDESDCDEDLQRYADRIHSLITVGMAELGHVAKSRGIVPSAHRAMSASDLFKNK